MLDKFTVIEGIQASDEIIRRLKYNRLERFAPNPTQQLFCNSTVPETAFMGANQVSGKSYTLKAILAIHLTGRYPKWWTGHRFKHPILAAIGGTTAASTRDLIVNGVYMPNGDEIIGLLGPEDERGSGFIPLDCFDPNQDIVPMQGGLKGQVDQFKCKHFTDGVFDGYSTCFIFSYQSGWERLRGYTLYAIGMDEEPKATENGFLIYDQFSTRLNKTGGVLYLAMSPEDGYTQIVQQFDGDKNGIRKIIFGRVDDAEHVDENQREFLKKKYEGHFLEQVRLEGHWVMGEGMIYNIEDERIVCEPFTIPDHWKRIIGLDVPHTTGYFAATWHAYDEDTDTLYLYDEFKAKNQPRSIYRDALFSKDGMTIPIAWPHDTERAMEVSVEYFRAGGLKMLHEAAYYITSDGIKSKKNNSIVAAIDEVRDRMRVGKFKVFSTCQGFLREKRMYHAKDGYPAKEQDDHLINSNHKAVMMLRYAKPMDYERPRHPPIYGSEEFFQ